MTKKYVLKLVSLVLVSAMMASPVMGAVCTMSCGDTRSCCCAGSGERGELAYSAPDCCEGEFQTEGFSDALTDRHYSSFSPLPFTAPAAVQVNAFHDCDTGGSASSVSLADLRPPPSPLFILNASFLI